VEEGQRFHPALDMSGFHPFTGEGIDIGDRPCGFTRLSTELISSFVSSSRTTMTGGFYQDCCWLVERIFGPDNW
jgi:hypothetical protein